MTQVMDDVNGGVCGGGVDGDGCDGIRKMMMTI